MDKFTIESSLFDVIQELHSSFQFKLRDKYKLCLVAMDELNEEYKVQTGEYYLHPEKALSYYEKLWDM